VVGECDKDTLGESECATGGGLLPTLLMCVGQSAVCVCWAVLHSAGLCVWCRGAFRVCRTVRVCSAVRVCGAVCVSSLTGCATC